MATYFYYQKNMLSRWAPTLTDHRPDTRSADGAKRTIAQEIEVPQTHENLSLHELAEMFPFQETST